MSLSAGTGGRVLCAVPRHFGRAVASMDPRATPKTVKLGRFLLVAAKTTSWPVSESYGPNENSCCVVAGHTGHLP